MNELEYRDLFGTQIDVGDIMLLAKNTSAAEYSIVPFRVLGKGQRNSQEGPIPTLQLRQILLGKQWYEATNRFSPRVVKLYRSKQTAPVNNWTFQRGVCLAFGEFQEESCFGLDATVLFNSFAGDHESIDEDSVDGASWINLKAAYDAAADKEEA